MRVLKVQGKGYVSIEPDIVTLSFEVETKAKEYAQCIQQLNSRAEALRASMTAAGLDRTELKTSSFGIRYVTEYNELRKPVFIGYRAAHQMSIELPVDKDLLNRTLRQVAVGHSGAEISLHFSVKDQEGLRRLVLTEAVRVAQRNAETLASAAGVRLGQLQQMDYGWSEVHIYSRDAAMVCASPAAMPEYNADIDPANVGAEDNVTLVYEIVQ